jgi:hypothetical protein
MNLRLATVSLALLSSLPLLSGAEQPEPIAASSTNLIKHELLVAYDVTGSTLTGPFDLNVEVYNDGLAKISGVNNSGGDARITYVTPAEARQLARDLHDAGAWQLPDQPGNFTDVSLKTLTVLRGTSKQIGHSFSYWIGQDEYQPVEAVMQLFVATEFPGF